MILLSLCNSCFQPYQVLLQPSDVELVKQVADEGGQSCPCPRLCGGKINLIGDATISAMGKDRRLKDPIHITGRQLYQAVNGLGLPDEIPTDALVVDSLLKSNKLTGSVVEEVNGRLYLHELKLENGITIHLAAGQRGAQVLKMTKERTSGT